MEWLQQISPWHWLALGVALMMLEIFVSGTVLMWMGFSAMLVGVTLWLVPTLSWETQVLIFSVGSIFAILIWWNYFKKHPVPSEDPLLNRRAEQYVGRVFTLEHAIVDGVGKIHVDDSTWKVNGPDLQAGAKIKIVGVKGVILQVESL